MDDNYEALEEYGTMIADALADLQDIIKYLPDVKKSDRKKLKKYVKKLESGEASVYDQLPV